ncbi:MAG: hypothetical protein AB7I50_08035 [Vicinamibacterales bacterium]
MSRHFDLTDWNDFARDVASQDRRGAMEAHLGAGCDRCREVLRVQRAIVDAAAREVGYEPPEALVRMVKAIFPVRAANPLASLPATLATFLREVGQQPVPLGVRGTKGGSRHALYETDGASVDLRLEQHAATQRLLLVGQVLEHGESGVAGTMPAVLVQGDRVVGQSSINEFGEFRLECPAGSGLTLQVPVENGTRRLDVPLAPLVGDGDDQGASRGC